MDSLTTSRRSSFFMAASTNSVHIRSLSSPPLTFYGFTMRHRWHAHRRYDFVPSNDPSSFRSSIFIVIQVTERRRSFGTLLGVHFFFLRITRFFFDRDHRVLIRVFQRRLFNVNCFTFRFFMALRNHGFLPRPYFFFDWFRRSFYVEGGFQVTRRFKGFFVASGRYVWLVVRGFFGPLFFISSCLF